MNKKDNNEGSELMDQKKGNEERKTGIKKEEGNRREGSRRVTQQSLPFPRDSFVHRLVLTHGTWKSLNAGNHTYDCVEIRAYLLVSHVFTRHLKTIV